MTEQIVYEFYQCTHPNECYGRNYYECREVNEIPYPDGGSEMRCRKSPTQRCFDYVLVEKDSPKCGPPEKFCIIDGVNVGGETRCIDNVLYYCKPGAGWVVSNPMLYCGTSYTPTDEVPSSETPPGEVTPVEEPNSQNSLGLSDVAPVLAVAGIGIALFAVFRLLGGRRE